MNLLFQKFIQKLNENIIDVYISLNKKLIKIRYIHIRDIKIK